IGRAADEVGRLFGDAMALVLGLDQRLPIEGADEVRRVDDDEVGLGVVAADVLTEFDAAVDQRQAEGRRLLAEAQARRVGNDDAAIDAASHGRSSSRRAEHRPALAPAQNRWYTKLSRLGHEVVKPCAAAARNEQRRSRA